MTRNFRYRLASAVFAILLTSGLTGCAERLRDLRQLPLDLQDIPGIPPALRDLPDILDELELPDLSQIADLPGLDALPSMAAVPGAVVYRGPTERRVNVGERIPGTDIALVSVGDDGAEFRVAGLRSVRMVGDSLDYDGVWGDAQGVDYSLRLRIYRIGANHVRAAGVHQLQVRDADPAPGDSDLRGYVMRFPMAASLARGESIEGTTFGYVGSDQRGAQISGLPEGNYAYRKLGDSIHWQGTLRSGVSVEYNLRLLYYGNDNAQIGGTVGVAIAPE